MGEIVAAMASVHAPQLFTRPPEEDPKQLDAGIAAMRQLGKVLDETRPDALIIFASDHMETFFLRTVPTFAIMVSERANAGLRRQDLEPADPSALAEALLEQLVRRDFDMAYSQDADLGHSSLPFSNGFGEPGDPRGAYLREYVSAAAAKSTAVRGAGQGHRRVIGGRPERVAVLASGGMSHYPGTARYYQPAYDFDRWCIQRTGKQPRRFLPQPDTRTAR